MCFRASPLIFTPAHPRQGHVAMTYDEILDVLRNVRLLKIQTSPKRKAL